MANKTITQLPLDNILSGVEEIPLFQSGKTSKTNLQAIAEFVKNSIPGGTPDTPGGTPDTPGGSSLIISATAPIGTDGTEWLSTNTGVKYTKLGETFIEL